jgi:anti-sigma regulatory factor (Ser/Thr protein kinase)
VAAPFRHSAGGLLTEKNVVTDNLRGHAPASLGLRLQALAESVPLLRQELRIWLARAGATKNETFEVLLATTEAFANAIEHPQQPTSHLVDVTGAIIDHTVTVLIRDYGTWGSEQTRKEEGGMGLLMMEELMDAVQIQRFLDGTTVTMRRRLAMLSK